MYFNLVSSLALGEYLLPSLLWDCSPPSWDLLSYTLDLFLGLYLLVYFVRLIIGRRHAITPIVGPVYIRLDNLNANGLVM